MDGDIISEEDYNLDFRVWPRQPEPLGEGYQHTFCFDYSFLYIEQDSEWYMMICYGYMDLKLDSELNCVSKL